MPDLFDNFFGKVNHAVTGKSPKVHYTSSSQVNTGKFYSYHNSASNNNYWLPTKKNLGPSEDDQSPQIKARMGSVGSMSSDTSDQEGRSRMGSVVSESDGK